ncbi:MAG: serine protease, partial [Clostridia bacterium]
RCENYSAKVVATDEANDLALIQLDADLGNMDVLSGRTSLKIANIDNVKVGDEVCTLGNPRGIRLVLTRGSISGIGYGDYGFNKTSGYNRFLVDITSTNGSSGGAVCNGRGEVVGIITQGCDELPHQAACVSCLAIQQLMSVYYKKNK